MPQRRLQHLGITLPLRDTIGFGVQWVQDAQMGWGDAVEEVMTEGTNKPGAGLTGLPGKPISPFIPARPWGPWRGEKMKMRVLRAGASPIPLCPGLAPFLPMGYEEDGDGDLPRVPSVPAAPAPPADSGEGKGITTRTTRHPLHRDVPPIPAAHPPFLLSPSQ